MLSLCSLSSVSTVEARNHSKNGAGLKSQMSRENFFRKINRFFKFCLLLILASGVLCSCASTTQFYEYTHKSTINDSKYGRIYVMRKKSMLGAAVTTYIFCNNVRIGSTGNGSYLCWDMPEGTYRIATVQHTLSGKAGVAEGEEFTATIVDSNTGRRYTQTAIAAEKGAYTIQDFLEIDVTPGSTYYIKQYPRSGGFSFEIMNSEDGEQAIRKGKAPKVNLTK